MTSQRITQVTAERIRAEISPRDEAILDAVAQLRVLTSRQLERLLFTELQGDHRDRTRRRVLARLVRLNVLATLDRRIGGARSGSAGLIFVLGPVGQRLAEDLAITARRVRPPSTPTDRFLLHVLSVSELYVQLAELSRQQVVKLVSFDAEPACWWPDSAGNWIKPDAYVRLESSTLADSWAIEVDRATESLPTLRRKLRHYLDLVADGEAGPAGDPFPRVLVTVPTEPRRQAVQDLLTTLPPLAEQLFAVVLAERAAWFVIDALHQ